MTPDEIIRRRIPPTYGYKIPHSELIDQQHPSIHELVGYSSHLHDSNQSESLNSNDANHVESRLNQGEESVTRYKMAPSKLSPASYAHRIAVDQTMIATDIRKYLSSNHVNPLSNSNYLDSRRRLAKFFHSF